MAEESGTVQIRPAVTGDCGTIYAMLCELEEENFDKGEFERIYKENLASDTIHYLMAEIDKNPVGFLSLYIQQLLHHSGKVAEIQELFVNNTIRGKGIGALLVSAARKIATDHGCKIIEVTCNMKRENTHRFYEKNGFKKTHYKFTQALP